MKTRLQRVLKAVKQPSRLLRFPDGTQLLVLVHGGRALGLFAPDDDDNFFWTNKALAAPGTASALFSDGAWCNSGGDRLWLSPEIDFFFPNYPKLDRYWQPRELDPARYQIKKGDGYLTLKTQMKLTLSRTQAVGEFSISKTFAPAPDPLRYEHPKAGGNVRYAGYSQTVTLASVKQDHKNPSYVSLWSLLQLPHGGDMLIPTYGRGKAEVFMGSVPRSALRVREGLIRWRMAAKGEHKVSVRALDCIGRVGYVHRRSRRQWDLVVRNFQMNPSGHYPEVPWRKPTEVGHCVQACNVNSALGRFNELEYHAPAITTSATSSTHPGATFCQDTSQVWAYRGTPSAIHHTAKLLLGNSI